MVTADENVNLKSSIVSRVINKFQPSQVRESLLTVAQGKGRQWLTDHWYGEEEELENQKLITS